DDYVAANRKTFESLNKVDYGEFLYRAVLLSFLDLIGLTPRAEVHSSRGRSGLEFTTNEGQVWVMELKICRKDGEDESLAEAALNQIIAKGSGDRHKNPVLLGVAINDNERAITAWKVQGLTASPGK
ncbi:MAG: PD-(D/E)XK nuclease domain-containing protein, partial [Deltaproteobacteria bacterium]|nr:PD-(D/E)XK nuclease domain-containing protein [Deltaproteobacteria bacterium]